MPFVSTRPIAPAQVSGTTDGALLDTLETTTLDAENIAPSSVLNAHMLAVRAASADDCGLPVTTWIGTVTVGAGSQTISNDIYPGDTIELAAVPLRLVLPDTTVALLRTGDVLRWHGMIRVTEIDDSGFPENDLYHVVVRIKGHGSDLIGVWKTGANDPKFGIVHTFSMNAARLPATSDGAGANKELWDQWISFSGAYIHDEDNSPWTGTTAMIDEIEVSLYVETAVNSVTVEAGKLTVMVIKG